MSFTTEIDVINIGVSTPGADEIEAGADPTLTIDLTSALVMPVVEGGRPVGMMPVPAGVYRFAFEDREDALKFAEEVRTQAEKLPSRRKSDIITASNLAQVEDAARNLGQFR